MATVVSAVQLLAASEAALWYFAIHELFAVHQIIIVIYGHCRDIRNLAEEALIKKSMTYYSDVTVLLSCSYSLLYQNRNVTYERLDLIGFLDSYQLLRQSHHV